MSREAGSAGTEAAASQQDQVGLSQGLWNPMLWSHLIIFCRDQDLWILLAMGEERISGDSNLRQRDPGH